MKIGPLTLGNLIWILGILLVLAALVYVDVTHDVTSATVLDKRERIERNVTKATWKRHAEAQVRYSVDERVYERWIPLDTAIYDATRRGSELSIRYVPINPDWARLESQSTLAAMLQRVDAWQSFTWLVLVGGVVFAIHRHRKMGIKHWWLQPRPLGAQILVLAAMILWIEIVAAGYFPPPRPGISDSPRNDTAQATVRDVTSVTQVGGGGRSSSSSLPIGLIQGFDRVELLFTPDGWADPVVAIDEINEGSAGELTAGMTVPVSYSPDHPRQARLETGSRSHRWKNPLAIQGLIGVFAGLVLLAPVITRTARSSVATAIEQTNQR